jgi:hypothetical protein
MNTGDILIGLASVAFALGGMGDIGGFDFSPLMTAGPIGAVCGWFMLRLERRLESLDTSFRLTGEAIAIMLVQIPEVSDAAKKQLNEILRKLEESKIKRDK